MQLAQNAHGKFLQMVVVVSNTPQHAENYHSALTEHV